MDISASYYSAPGLSKKNLNKIREQIPKLTLEYILDTVAEETQMEIRWIKGRRRGTDLVKARHIYFYVSKMNTDFKLREIGDLLDRDHTTVMHGVNNIRNYMNNEDDLRHTVQIIENRILEKK